MKRKVWSIILSLCMAFSVLPATAFAEELGGDAEQQTDKPMENVTSDVENLDDAPQDNATGDVENPVDTPQDNATGDVENPVDTPQDNATGDMENPVDTPQDNATGDIENPVDTPQDNATGDAENLEDNATGDAENLEDTPQGNNENLEEAKTLVPMNTLQETSTVKKLNIADGSIHITETGYIIDDGGDTEEIPFTGNYVISGTSTEDVLEIVKLPENSTITLKDLSIDVSGKGPAIIIGNQAGEIQLNVEGDVSVKSDVPALIVSTPLAIRGTGNLTLSSFVPVVDCGNSTSFDVEISGDINIQGQNAPCVSGVNCHSKLKSLNGKITIAGQIMAFQTKKVTLEAKEDIKITSGVEANSPGSGPQGGPPVIISQEDVSIISHEGSVAVEGQGSAINAGSPRGPIPGDPEASSSVTIEAQKDITVKTGTAGMEGVGATGNISLVSHKGKIGVNGMQALVCRGNVTVDADGDITATGRIVGIGAGGDKISLTSTNGSINVKATDGSNPAIIVGGGIHGGQGTVTVTAPKGDVTLEKTPISEKRPVVDGILSITEGTVCVLNGGTADAKFADDGSQDRVVVPVTESLNFTTEDSKTAPGYDWNKDTKTLTLRGLYLTAPSNASSAISAPDGTTLILKGKNKIAFQELNNANIGILAYGALKVQGEGSLTMNNVRIGIEGNSDEDTRSKDIVISEGHITINAKEDGLRNTGNITISGGNLRITAKVGMASYGDVAISGGTVTIYTKDHGITIMSESDNKTIHSITINGGTVNVIMGKGTMGGIVGMNAKIVFSGGAVTVQRESGVSEEIMAIGISFASMTGTETIPQNVVVDTDKVKVVQGGTVAAVPWQKMNMGYVSAMSFSESGKLRLDITTIEDRCDAKLIGASSKVVIVPKSAYQVSFEANGGSTVASQTVQEGGKATQPVNPIKAKSRFLGWYQDVNGTIAWNFDKDAVTKDVTLYAKWKHKSSDDSSDKKDDSGTTGGGGSGGASTKVADKKETPETKPETKGEPTTAKPSATVEGKTATATITATDAGKIINDAVKNGSSEILIQPEVKDDVDKEVVSLSKDSVADMASKTDSKLSVVTPSAKVTILKEGVSALSKETGANISVSVEKKAENTRVEVKADDKVLEQIPGGISVTVPVENMTAGTVVMVEKADGTTHVIHNAVKENKGFRVPLQGSATIKVVDYSKTFRDVQQTDWFYDSVTFATSHQLFSGTSETTFSPNAKMTRGMIVTTFYHLANDPVGGQATFKDVPADAYYANAVAWASVNHIVSGYGDRFAAEDEVTREQLAAFMYNYAKAKGLDVSAKGDIDKFSDHGKVSSWASEAIAYAVGSGIMSGKDEQTLDPKGSATRAEVASLLKRYIEETSK